MNPLCSLLSLSFLLLLRRLHPVIAFLLMLHLLHLPVSLSPAMLLLPLHVASLLPFFCLCCCFSHFSFGSTSAVPAGNLILFKFLISLFKHDCFFTSFFVVGIFLGIFLTVLLLCLSLRVSRESFFLCALITNVAMTPLWLPPRGSCRWLQCLCGNQVPSFNQYVVEFFLCAFLCSVRVLFFKRLSVHCVERN